MSKTNYNWLYSLKYSLNLQGLMPLIFLVQSRKSYIYWAFIWVFLYCHISNLTVLSNSLYLPTFENTNTICFCVCIFLSVFSDIPLILPSINFYALASLIMQTRGYSCVIETISCKFSLINCGSWIISTVISGCCIRSIDVAISWMFSSVNCASG